MRAVGVVEFGGPEALQLLEIPEPHAGPGQVRIRVRAVAVSPTDTLLRSGATADRLKDIPPPYVPGFDLAGVIDEVAEGADTDLRVGDAVMAIVVPYGSGGAYAERVVAPVESVARIPAGASFAEASTLPMNGRTAQVTLDVLALEPGQTLAVTGAAGTYGGYVVQLAKVAGLRVIADAAEKDQALVHGFGADVVVRRGDDVAARIRAVVPEGVDAVADGSLQHRLLLSAIKDGGQLASVRDYQGPLERGITQHRVRVSSFARDRAALERLRELAEQGKLTLRVAGILPFDQAAEAHRLLAAGGTRGRYVLEL